MASWLAVLGIEFPSNIFSLKFGNNGLRLPLHFIGCTPQSCLGLANQCVCSIIHAFPWLNPSRISARTANKYNFRMFLTKSVIKCNLINCRISHPMLTFRFQFDQMVNFLHFSVTNIHFKIRLKTPGRCKDELSEGRMFEYVWQCLYMQ